MYYPCISAGQPVLDLAAGSGRHSRLLAAAGYPVLAVDRDARALADLQAFCPGVTTQCCDLEGGDWPLAGGQFAGVVVCNYLWRPRLDAVWDLVAAGGFVIYETFMVGNAVYGSPRNPDFLLQPGELRASATAAGLELVAAFEGYVPLPRPAMRQAIIAHRPA